MSPLGMVALSAVCSGSCALLFRVRGRQVLVCAIAGGAVWAAYELAELTGWGYLFSNFCAAAAGTLLAELCARLMRRTATSFLVPSVIPLIPGGWLFYAMEALVEGDRAAALSNASRAAATAGVIAVGIYVVSSLFRYIRPRRSGRKQTEG